MLQSPEYFTVTDKLVQLIYIGGAIFNILNSRVRDGLVSYKHYMYVTSAELRGVLELISLASPLRKRLQPAIFLALQ